MIAERGLQRAGASFGGHAVRVPGSLQAALAITGILTVVFGVLPGIISRYGELSDLAGAVGKNGGSRCRPSLWFVSPLTEPSSVSRDERRRRGDGRGSPGDR